MATKEVPVRDNSNEELKKLEAKYDRLAWQHHGDSMRLMTYEARLSSEVKKNCELEVQLKLAKEKIKELEAKCVGCAHEDETGSPCYQHGEVIKGPFSFEVKIQ